MEGGWQPNIGDITMIYGIFDYPTGKRRTIHKNGKKIQQSQWCYSTGCRFVSPRTKMRRGEVRFGIGYTDARSGKGKESRIRVGYEWRNNAK
jgi:hypothetical protein